MSVALDDPVMGSLGQTIVTDFPDEETGLKGQVTWSKPHSDGRDGLFWLMLLQGAPSLEPSAQPNASYVKHKD